MVSNELCLARLAGFAGGRPDPLRRQSAMGLEPHEPMDLGVAGMLVEFALVGADIARLAFRICLPDGPCRACFGVDHHHAYPRTGASKPRLGDSVGAIGRFLTGKDGYFS